MLLGVDVGGTFTDAVLAFDRRIVTAKAPSTPADQSEGVMAAIQAALEQRVRGDGHAVRERSDLSGRPARALEPMACAEGIIRVANAEMIRALRVVTVQRGIDPRRYALLAFGGAGPLHAVAIAEELGIDRIVCPRASGVLAALGLVVSPRRRDAQRSVLLSGDSLTAEAVADAVAELGEQARAALGVGDAELRAIYELRYRGQAFELAVSAGARFNWRIG